MKKKNLDYFKVEIGCDWKYHREVHFINGKVEMYLVGRAISDHYVWSGYTHYGETFNRKANDEEIRKAIGKLTKEKKPENVSKIEILQNILQDMMKAGKW